MKMYRLSVFVWTAAIFYIGFICDAHVINTGKPKGGQLDQQEQQNPNVKNDCTCAVMESDNSTIAVIEKTIDVPLGCDETGSHKCQQFCIGAVEIAVLDEVAGPLFCEQVKNTTSLKVHVFSKSCSTGPYLFTGLKYNDTVSCKDGKYIPKDVSPKC